MIMLRVCQELMIMPVVQQRYWKRRGSFLNTISLYIIFALWDEEEQGLIGSDAYASSAAASNENILGYINMDMLGWDGNNDNVADIHVRPVASSLALLDKAMVANIDYDIGLSLHLVNRYFGMDMCILEQWIQCYWN